MGTPQSGSMGLGRASVRGRRRVPRPAARRMARVGAGAVGAAGSDE